MPRTYNYDQYEGLLVVRKDKVMTITLNAPESLNAFTGGMHNSMSRIWDDVNDDPEVHVVVLTGEDFVARLNDKLVAQIVKPIAGVVRDGGGLLQDGVGRDHFAGNQVLPNREVFKRTLGLRAPEFVGGDIYLAETVGFFANVWHLHSPF